MSATPGALQLRLLQTIADVASEKNSTLVMPFPVELLRFFDRAGQDTAGAGSAVEPLATAIPDYVPVANGHRDGVGPEALDPTPARH